MGVSRHDAKHPGLWFALGATAGWLGAFLLEFARDSTPSRDKGPEGALESQIIGVFLTVGVLTVIFAAWVAIRRRRRPWSAVPFVLPLTLGLLQVAPILIAEALDRLIGRSPIVACVVVFSVFAGPVLAAEIVTRRARVPDVPLSPSSPHRLKSSA